MPLELNDVSYVYAPGTPFETAALAHINLTIEQGEFLGIMGHTGCGKSTLIQLLAGLLTPTEGTVTLDGADLNRREFDRSVLRKKVGMVFQYPEYQLFETTVEKDVAFGLRHLGLDKTECDRRVRWALETMGFSFERIREQSPLGLSGGEKRRVAIAGILAPQPAYLILDEPVAGLDPIGRDAFLQLTQSLNAFGTTIIMISHNADVMAEYAKRIIVLDHGRLVHNGTPCQVLSRTGEGQVQQVLRLLRARGQDVPDDLVRYNELLSCMAALGKGGKV